MHRSPLLPFVLAPLVLQALARPHCKTPTNGKVIYMLSNEPENAVVAVPIGKDGHLTTDVTFTATGGAGMNGMDTENKPAFPDALFSQSSVTIAGDVCVPPSQNSLPYQANSSSLLSMFLSFLH